MFCQNCGKPIGPDTRFCPACGTAVLQSGEAFHQPPPPPSQAEPGSQAGPNATPWAGSSSGARTLVRPRSSRMLGGVCAGFALYFGWNVNVVRIATVIFAFFYGVGVLAYIACWIILPEAQYALPAQSR